MENLYYKYDQAVPRYTSYPAYPFWNGLPSETLWLEHLQLDLKTYPKCDIYIHVPFCEKLCTYCGCTRTITRDHSVETPYVDAIIQEWRHQLTLCPSLEINSIHFGGGTPSFLSPTNLDLLLENLAQGNGQDFKLEGSIELDPRVTTREHLQVLSKWNIKRISMGVQDFDPDVQKAINRIQSFEMVQKLISQAKEEGIEEINFDLIFGLPLQTTKSIQNTFEKVIDLRPDTIAFFSYAHLPKKIRHQKALDRFHIPTGKEKRTLYECGKNILETSSYYEIGLDHFALGSSSLYKALCEDRLFRNFMGYTTQDVPIVIGLGPSSISSTTRSYRQNEKNPNTYQNLIKQQGHAAIYGHQQSRQDRESLKIIQSIMNSKPVDLSAFFEFLTPSIILKIESELLEFQKDEIITYHNRVVCLTKQGRPFMRNVCASLDTYLHNKDSFRGFSRSI